MKCNTIISSSSSFPLQGFSGWKPVALEFLGSVVGYFYPWHLALLSPLCSRLVPRALFGTFLALSSSLWLSLYLLALSGLLFVLSLALFDVSSPFYPKTSGKTPVKNLRKILGWHFGSLWRSLSIPGSLWPFAALSCLLLTLWHSLALSLGPGESLNPQNILSSLS